MALVFVFASLFLGEMRGYYNRSWWWDVALHTTSGLLLGIFGFLMVYVLHSGNGRRECWSLAWASSLVRVIVSSLPSGLPRSESIGVDGTVLWFAFFVARATGDPGGIVASIPQVIRNLEPLATVADVRRMSEVVSGATADSRFFTMLLSAFGALALLLGAVGVYGVLSYIVSQRTQEFGIRMALGANPARVAANAMLRGLGPVAMGLGAGVLGALATTRFLESLLFQVSSTDRLS